MIISDVKKDVVASGIVSRTMTVKADATSLALELENLYTNPHKAIVRELTSNAIDSHNRISNKDSYWIQVPTPLNPVFKIRDFGTGLTPDEVEEYLNRLYSGTKREDNDQIGGFGLGAKSPFALVDTVTLMSFKDGKVHEYLWYKDEDGIPTMVIQDTRDTEEPNGILYVVPLEEKDIFSIAQACASETFTFAILPRFFKDFNDLESEFDLLAEARYKRIFDSNTCAVYEYPSTSYNNYYYNRNYYQGMSLSIGGVHYQIPSNVQRGLIVNNTFNSLFNFNTYQFVVKLPIGSVKVPKNRETILETTSNRDTIIKAIDKATNDYVQEYIVEEFTNQLSTTFITNYEQLFVMLHQYALDKGVYLDRILDLFKESIGIFEPNGIFKDLVVTPSTKPLNYLACLYTHNPYASTHPSYYVNTPFFTYKDVALGLYKTDMRRSSYLHDITRTPYSHTEKILFVFTGSSKFMGANLQTIQGIEEFTRIIRIDVNHELAAKDKDAFFAILELLIPLYYPQATLKNFKDIEVAPRTTSRQRALESPMLNIRYFNISSDMLLQASSMSYTQAEKIYHILDDNGKKMPFGLDYITDDKVLYIKREDFDPYSYSNILYKYYASLGYTKIYLVNESLYDTFLKVLEGSSKVTSNLKAHEGLYDFSNIEQELLEQFWHYINIYEASVLKPTYDFLCDRFKDELSLLRIERQHWRGLAVYVLPEPFDCIFRLLDLTKIKELLKDYNFRNIFDDLSREELTSLLKESLAPVLFEKINIKGDENNA